MLVDQFGNQPGQVLGRQPVIQRWRQRPLTGVQHAEVLPATRLRTTEVRVCALSESYLGQSTTTELIGHPSCRAPCAQPNTPPGVLPARRCRSARRRARRHPRLGGAGQARAVGRGTVYADSAEMLGGLERVGVRPIH